MVTTARARRAVVSKSRSNSKSKTKNTIKPKTNTNGRTTVKTVALGRDNNTRHILSSNNRKTAATTIMKSKGKVVTHRATPISRKGHVELKANKRVNTTTTKAIRVTSSPSTSLHNVPRSIIPTKLITDAPTSKGKGKGKGKGEKIEYLTAGLYCQDNNPPTSKTLISQVLRYRNSERNAKSKPITTTVNGVRSSNRPRRSGTGLNDTPRPTPSRASVVKVSSTARPTFPPLPYDHGYKLFFGKEHEFVLPSCIKEEAESGALDGKKKPTSYTKIRANVFPERQRISTDWSAVCKCLPESGCGERCINRIMSYICGKECPCGDGCTNKSLNKRKTPAYKVAYTGSRGFGVFAMEDIQEGEFVLDYRGEVISIDTFWDRIQVEYKGKKNFYALEYDKDEVIDAGMKGNDARFINHGCNPNLEVRKFQTLGDGWEEYEVGMWASRDIAKGEELFYDYNFESFGVAAQSDELRTKCCCGAPNCVGFLGRKVGEKSAKEIAAELEARRLDENRKALKKGKGKKGLAIMSAPPSMISASTSSSKSRESLELRTPTVDSSETNDKNKKRKSITYSESNGSSPSKRSKEDTIKLTKKQLIQLELQKKKEQLELELEEKKEEIRRRQEIAKRFKEEKVKARNGAPRGWAYVPLRVKATIPTSKGGRNPPRDRTKVRITRAVARRSM